MTIKVGDTVPEGSFSSVPYTPDLEDGLACGVPTKITTDAWKGKKVLIVAIPGAFTPTCHAKHIPPILAKKADIKSKVDQAYIIAANDAFVLSGWSRVQGIKDEFQTISDADAAWSKSLGLSVDLSARGLGVRTGRYALILDDLKVTFLGVEDAPGEVKASGVDNIIEAL